MNDWDQEFRILWDRGVKVRAMAKRLGCSRTHISATAKRLNLPSRSAEKIDLSVFAQMWREGASIEVIRLHFGILNHKTVGRAVKRFGLSPRPIGRPKVKV